MRNKALCLALPLVLLGSGAVSAEQTFAEMGDKTPSDVAMAAALDHPQHRAAGAAVLHRVPRERRR